VFQLLRVRETVMKVKTFEDAMEAHGAFDCTVQMFSRWCPGFDEKTTPPSQMEVFQVEESSDTIDIVKMIGDTTMLPHFVHWSVELSDVEGCHALRNPVPLSPTVSLGSPSCPTISILEALRQQGFVGVESRVDHVPEGARDFDSRSPFKHKSYLQCVLAQADLFSRGARAFPNQLSKAFYDLLRKCPDKARSGMTAKECKQMDNVFDGMAPGLAALDANAEHPAAPVPVPDPVWFDEHDSDIDGAGPVPLAGAPPVPWAGPIVGALSESSSSDSSSSSSSTSSTSSSALEPALPGPVDPDLEGAVGPPEFPEHILGQRVHLETHFDAHGVENARGIRVHCNNPAHIHCSKYRSLRLDVAEFGCRSAEFVLMAWLLGSHTIPADRHQKHKPSRANVREIRDTYG
jgi:hypothetical protein